MTASPAVTGKSFPIIADKLTEADPRSALIACWQAYNAATHKNAMSVTIRVDGEVHAIGVRGRGRHLRDQDRPAGRRCRRGPMPSADACVRGVIEPAIKDLKTLSDAFATKLTITIK